jgi:hypothetical protein
MMLWIELPVYFFLTIVLLFTIGCLIPYKFEKQYVKLFEKHLDFD